jgi:hypothetical protein
MRILRGDETYKDLVRSALALARWGSRGPAALVGFLI